MVVQLKGTNTGVVLLKRLEKHFLKQNQCKDRLQLYQLYLFGRRYRSSQQGIDGIIILLYSIIKYNIYKKV
jgi:hypothetical protein